MDPKDLPAWISAIAGIVSAGIAGIAAVSVLLAIKQLRLTKAIAQTQFEDTLGREYRELAARLPVDALLGEKLPDEEYRGAYDELFHYIDLSNEQVFLRQTHRVSREVWEYWSAGIQSNLKLPAFARAWEDIQVRSASFQELRRLARDGFASDPAEWNGPNSA